MHVWWRGAQARVQTQHTSDAVAASAALTRCYGQAEILNLLPHRGCMLLLRQITVHGPQAYTGEACWEDDDPFVLAHGCSVVPATLLVEAAAQAAGAGLIAVNRATGTPAKLGLLAGLRNCVFERQALIGRPFQLDVWTRFMTPLVAHAVVEVTQDKAKLASLQLLLAMSEA